MDSPVLAAMIFNGLNPLSIIMLSSSMDALPLDWIRPNAVDSVFSFSALPREMSPNILIWSLAPSAVEPNASSVLDASARSDISNGVLAAVSFS